MRLFTALFMMIFSFKAMAYDQRYVDLAQDVHQQIISDLYARCGVTTVDAFSPGLPRPQVQADLAFVSSSGQLLAYFDYYVSIGEAVYEYKNPNGGFSHKLEAGDERFSALTPYAGVVARSFYNRSTFGYHFYHYCGPYQVDDQAFVSCVDQRFTDVIVSQLCRF